MRGSMNTVLDQFSQTHVLGFRIQSSGNRHQRNLLIFKPSTLARSFTDSSLRASALPIAFRAMPFSARRRSFTISSDVQGWRCLTTASATGSALKDLALGRWIVGEDRKSVV